ncbi:MAG: DNA (cytosine-5-)-methyltransferase, partial [Actinomycetota bacterium]|nr:DNA (cytosine-5-)-methyltransferase [Actinomycetota bacterium]
MFDLWSTQEASEPGRIEDVTVHGVAISLFSGAGGLDLGAEQAGFHTAAAVEINDDAADTMEKNFPGLASPVVRRSILDVPTKELLRAAGLKGRERPELLVGGPPCTPFSKSGFWLEWKRAGLDPDASLLQCYTRVLAEARPRAFILENVYALTYRNKASRPAFGRLLQEIDEAGYHCRWRVLNAADHGVPQLRPRLFVVGTPKGTPLPDLPEATHSGQWERRTSGGGGRPHVTAGEALAGLVAVAEP